MSFFQSEKIVSMLLCQRDPKFKADCAPLIQTKLDVSFANLTYIFKSDRYKF